MKKTTSIIAAASTLALALALTGCGQQAETAPPDPSTGFELEVKAESWEADASTPVVVVLAPEAGEGEQAAEAIVNAIPANEVATVEVAPGAYALDLVSPINADGSIYKVPEGTKVQVADDEIGAGDPIELELIPAEQATSEQVTAIVSALTVALSDQAGVPDADAILEKAKENAKSNPNVTEEAVQAAKDEAEQAVESGSASVAGAAQASGNAGQQASAPAASGGSSSAPSQAAPSTPAHTHSFQPVYYTTQVQVGSQYVCNQCGANLGNNVDGHYTRGGSCVSYSVQPIYQTQQLVSHYQCSCGAIQ